MSASEPLTAQATSRRVRAIWAYSLLSQDRLADDAGIHRARLRAILARTNPKQASPQELLALAHVVEDVPLSFAAVGFDSDPEAEVAQLWTEVARLRTAIAELAAGLPAGSVRPQPGGALVHVLSSDPTSTEGLTQTAHHGAPGDQRGTGV